MRSVRGILGDTSEILEEFPKDSDGSAKVALIAIDRSMAAWGHMHKKGWSMYFRKPEILFAPDSMNKLQVFARTERGFIPVKQS
jgi:hypothetical protein